VNRPISILVVSVSLSLLSACGDKVITVSGTKCPLDKVTVLSSPSEDVLRANLISDSKIRYSGSIACTDTNPATRLNSATVRAYVNVDIDGKKIMAFSKNMKSREKTFYDLPDQSKTTKEKGRYVGDGSGKKSYMPEGKTAIFEVKYKNAAKKEAWKQISTSKVTKYTNKIRP